MSRPFDIFWKPTLPELGEVLAAQFAELAKRPSVDRCDNLIRNLADASTAIAQMRTRIERGDEPNA